MQKVKCLIPLLSKREFISHVPAHWRFSDSVWKILEKATATHSSTLAWEIPWTEETGRLQSMGSQRISRLRDFTFTFHFHALEKKMATHSSIVAWRIPGMGAQWAAIYRVTQSRTLLTWLSRSNMKISDLLCTRLEKQKGKKGITLKDELPGW